MGFIRADIQNYMYLRDKFVLIYVLTRFVPHDFLRAVPIQTNPG